jgi:hypothetical protein
LTTTSGQGHDLNAARCSLNGEERAVPDTQRIVKILNHSRRIFPPLKKLLFEIFWFVFAAVEIVRFLWSLLNH